MKQAAPGHSAAMALHLLTALANLLIAAADALAAAANELAAGDPTVVAALAVATVAFWLARSAQSRRAASEAASEAACAAQGASAQDADSGAQDADSGAQDADAHGADAGAGAGAHDVDTQDTSAYSTDSGARVRGLAAQQHALDDLARSVARAAELQSTWRAEIDALNFGYSEFVDFREALEAKVRGVEVSLECAGAVHAALRAELEAARAEVDALRGADDANTYYTNPNGRVVHSSLDCCISAAARRRPGAGPDEVYEYTEAHWGPEQLKLLQKLGGVCAACGVHA
jgi:hypothetical protein